MRIFSKSVQKLSKNTYNNKKGVYNMNLNDNFANLRKGEKIMGSIQIRTSGIKKSLLKYKPLKALIEYIWNGFDANANCVEVEYYENEFGGVIGLSIKDNGSGIKKDELSKKFTPFFESEKLINPDEKNRVSAVHGKNGIGRLTFFKFATKAIWSTVYEEQGKNYKYNIIIESNNLQDFDDSDPIETTEPVGTTVTFENVIGFSDIEQIEEFLIREFCWFLELNKDKNYIIKLNGKELNYYNNVSKEDTIKLVFDKSKIDFEVKFILWNEKHNSEYSCYYMIDSSDNELFKETTSLNNKSDKFYHSVYIKSKMFDNFFVNTKNEGQVTLGYNKFSDEFKYIIVEADSYLRKMRKPFLRKHSDNLINELEKVSAFPNYNTKNFFEKMRRDELENVVRELYQVQPKVFSGLNPEQKKTLVRFLDLIMQSDEANNLISIVDEIVDLDSEERQELACLLNTTKMSNIIKTTKLIQDRYKAIEELKELIFNKELKAKEVPHLQNFIEKQYWIFGEQYHLVTAAEPDFEEALRRYNYILTGEDVKTEIDHPDKNKEMDIFAVRQDIRSNEYTNIVVELKRPSVKLGEEELRQVKKYMNVILKQPKFNGHNMKWEFYLVGNEFDSSKYIENEIESQKNHGEKSLVFKIDKYKVYVKTWSEILAEFEMKHKYLNDKLELERQKLLPKGMTADSIVKDLDDNTANQPKEIVLS